MVYLLDDFPENKEEFEALAEVKEGVKYVLVVDPKVTWANAPELPEEERQTPVEGEEEEENAPEEEDEELKEYRNLLRKEERTEEDVTFDSEVGLKIESIRSFRSQAQKDSEFRNCVVSCL